MVYGTQITIVMGVYKPTNITGGAHIVGVFFGREQPPRRAESARGFPHQPCLRTPLRVFPVDMQLLALVCW